MSIDNYLIVTGGEHEASALDIEIYDGNTWWNIKRPSDLCGSDVKMVLHEGDCYLVGGQHGRLCFSANLSSLITHHKIGDDSKGELCLWRQMPNIPKQVAGGSLAVFGRRLVIQNGGALYAYSPYTHIWLHVLNVPDENLYCACVVCSGTELMVVGGVSRSAETKVTSSRVFKAFAKGKYHFDQSILPNNQ